MKLYVFSILAALAFLCPIYAQKTVTLVVFGEGMSKDAATQSALRSAIEQSYGTFVSSNTTILDDELIKDEIVSVSSGNIQKYKELAYSAMPNGRHSVTLEATVSLSKLTHFAQSKGAECELAGETYGANLQLARFYKDAEIKAIKHLINELTQMLPALYDYSLKVSDPIAVNTWKEEPDYQLVFTVTIKSNAASDLFCEIIQNTLLGLSMDYKTEQQYHQITGAPFEDYYFQTKNPKNDVFRLQGAPIIRFRSKEAMELLTEFINIKLIPSIYSFYILDNLGQKHFGPRKNSPPSGYYQPSVGLYADDCIRGLFKGNKWPVAFSIEVPMKEIGKYKSFTVKK